MHLVRAQSHGYTMTMFICPMYNRLFRREAQIVNTMRPLTLNGLVPPDDFPAADFEAVQTKLAANDKNPAHKNFVGAWSAISYRYMAVAEYDQQLTASLSTQPGAGNPIRYQQERDLFGFFSSGLSVFDAFCFGSFAIGAITGSTDFPFATEKDERNVNWKSLIAAYTKSFGADPIVPVLVGIDRNPVIERLRYNRNILTHRATYPRQHNLAVGSSTTTSATARIDRLQLTLDKNTTGPWRDEFKDLLAGGMAGIRAFVDAKL
jgi:hypothetical protein